MFQPPTGSTSDSSPESAEPTVLSPCGVYFDRILAEVRQVPASRRLAVLGLVTSVIQAEEQIDTPPKQGQPPGSQHVKLKRAELKRTCYIEEDGTIVLTPSKSPQPEFPEGLPRTAAWALVHRLRITHIQQLRNFTEAHLRELRLVGPVLLQEIKEVAAKRGVFLKFTR